MALHKHLVFIFMVVFVGATFERLNLATTCLAQVAANELTDSQQLQLEKAEALDQTVIKLYDEEKYDAAMAPAVESLKLREAVYGLEHFGVSDSLINLASLYEAQGQTDQAETYYKRALTNAEKSFGLESQEIVERLRNLAAFYTAQEKYAASEALYIRALDIRKKTLGRDHYKTGTSLNDLAVVYENQSKFSDAIPLYQQAIKIYENDQSVDTNETAIVIENLANLLYQQEEYRQAEPLFRRILAIRERAPDTDPAAIANALNDLAVLCGQIDKIDEAELLYKRSLKIFVETLGADHSESNQVRAKLADLRNQKIDNSSESDSDLGIKQAQALNSQINKLTADGNYAEAIQLANEHLVLIKKALGPDNSEVAASLNNLAGLYEKQGNYTDAEPLFQRALKIFELTLGRDHPDTASCLNNLAILYKAQGNYAAAEPLYKRALEIREKSLGPDHTNTAQSLNNLAMFFESQGNYAAAEPLYKRALAINEKALGPDHSEIAANLNNLANFFEGQGNYAAAEPLFKRALKINEKTLGPEHPVTAMILNNLAGLYKTQGNYADAEPLFKRALMIKEKALGPEHPSTATSLNSLAELYVTQGNSAAAELLCKRAIAICEKALGANHPDTADSLNILAVLYENQGNYAAAEPLYRRTLSICEKVLGPDHPYTAQSLNNLALLYNTQGNHAAADPLLKRALIIKEKYWGPNHPSTALSLGNLAFSYSSQENYADAELLYKRALKIVETALGPDHPDTATRLDNLAVHYESQNHYVAAEPLYKRALAIREKALGPDHPDVAISLNNFAGLSLSQRNYAAAEPLYQRALKIMETALGPNHPNRTKCLNNLALLYTAMGNTDQTTAAFDTARRGIREHVTQVLPALAPSEQSMFLSANYESNFYGSLTHAFQHQEQADLVRKSSAWVINGKAVAQEALAQRNLLTRDIKNPKLAPIFGELLKVREQLAGLAMSTAEPEQTEIRLAKIAQLTARELELSRLLSGGQTDNAGAKSSWIDVDQVRSALPKSSVLIDIARFNVFNFTAKSMEEKWQPAHYSAWITFADETKEPVLVDLGLADEIDALIAKVLSGITSGADANGTLQQHGDEAAMFSVRKDLALLADRIWHPVQSYLGDADKIILSPDGALWLVPWNAIPVADDRYLIEKYDLRYVISGRDLVTEPGKFVSGRSVILANPTFDQNAIDKQSSIQAIFKEVQPTDSETTRSFFAKSALAEASPLPNSGVEAIAIQPNLDQYTGGKSTLYAERYALERVAKALSRPKVAAFATHGFFLSKQEAKPDKRNQLASSEIRSSTLDTTGHPIENPLLRCGLLFAGCNDRNAVVGDDDGILTGMEIVGIDFRGTELVVLSACETGVGDVKNGEGVAGLRQAFQLAGAEAVVASLWQVPDRDSAFLMIDFFKQLAAGQSKSAALRTAQINRIEYRRQHYGAAHPFYWAAFTLTGR